MDFFGFMLKFMKNARFLIHFKEILTCAAAGILLGNLKVFCVSLNLVEMVGT
jgi:hypothetical protein